MKQTITPLLLVLSLSCSAMSQDSISKSRQNQSKQVTQFYNQAEKAYRDGDLASAKTALRNVFAIDRNHGPSYALALKMKGSGNDFKIKARQRQLAAVIIPQVEFDQMPLGDALRDLSTLIEETSKDKVIPNFVIQDQSNTLKTIPVTLNMKQVPATVILEYLMNLTNSTAKFDQYAITVKPRSSRAAAPSKPVVKDNEF